ncbi:MAG TPA: hypothetical protein VMT51_12090, partial [Dongiaceae bacterium]|nr:hypothetical protein [Dongiaceae bacterium]
MSATRREFLTTTAMASLALKFLPPGAANLPLAFSTLGCPKWTWAQTLDFASAHGFSAIELRGILGDLDTP